MKKFILSLMVAAATFFMTSCDQPDVHVHINVEQVPCTFTASTFIPNVDDRPMSRTNGEIEPRDITCIFESVTSGHVVEQVVKEHDLVTVELNKNETYNAKFIHATNMNDLNNILIDEHVYGYDEQINVGNGVHKVIMLTRKIGKLTAKVGHIPTNTHVKFDISTYGTIDKNYQAVGEMDLISSEKLNANSLFSKLGVVGNNYGIITVYLYNKHDKLVKTSTHPYSILENRERIITFNIDASGDDEDWSDIFIDIDEKWGTVDKDDQQIGKPQN